jgi:hypothetical protein
MQIPAGVRIGSPLIDRSLLTLETFQSDPPSQYIDGGTFFTATNVTFFGTKTLAHRRGEMSDGKYTVLNGL